MPSATRVVFRRGTNSFCSLRLPLLKLLDFFAELLLSFYAGNFGNRRADKNITRSCRCVIPPSNRLYIIQGDIRMYLS